jgi:hypothetical protein
MCAGLCVYNLHIHVKESVSGFTTIPFPSSNTSRFGADNLTEVYIENSADLRPSTLPPAATESRAFSSIKKEAKIFMAFGVG